MSYGCPGDFCFLGLFFKGSKKLDTKKYSEIDTVWVETPGYMALVSRSLGISNQPIDIKGSVFEIPEQNLERGTLAGRAVAFFMATRRSGDTSISGKLVMCPENHFGFFEKEVVSPVM